MISFPGLAYHWTTRVVPFIVTPLPQRDPVFMDWYLNFIWIVKFVKEEEIRLYLARKNLYSTTKTKERKESKYEEKRKKDWRNR